MKDKYEAGARTSMGASAAEAILALPRQQKRLIMLLADAVAIPVALWSALILKFDRLDPNPRAHRGVFPGRARCLAGHFLDARPVPGGHPLHGSALHVDGGHAA